MYLLKTISVNYYGFNTIVRRKCIQNAQIAKNNQKFEEAVIPIIIHILTHCENFTHIEQGPKVRGTPFDFLGHKNGKPYIVELKASMEYFNRPGIVQRERMLILQKKIANLHIALLQFRLINSTYRIYYDDELLSILRKDRRRASFEPIVEWINRRIVKLT